MSITLSNFTSCLFLVLYYAKMKRAMNSMEPIKENRFLSLNSLSKNYGEQKVLSALSYSFYPKGLYLLFGENGSGKSTLLNILSGKETDYEGKISCSGEELSKKNRESFSDNYVSYVAQDALFFEDRKVIDDFLLPYEKKDKEKAKKILTDLGLENVLNEKCKELSEGEKERLCFGQAIYADKKIVLLDEITANLDPLSTEKILRYVLELSKNRLVIFATHDNRPEWFTKDAFILRRKDGKLTEEKEGVFDDSETTVKKKKGFYTSPLLSSFKTDKKFHSLLAVFCALLTIFSFWSISVSKSTETTTSFSDTGEVRTKSPYQEACNQVFLQTAPVLPTFHPLPDETIVYPVVYASWLWINENTQASGEEYKIPGKTFEGICIYQDNDPDKVKLTEGKYPTEQFECIIPDICQRNNPELRIGSKIKSHDQQGSFKIVGIYKAENPNTIALKYKDYDPTDPADVDYSLDLIPRLIYSFKTETIFCGQGTYLNQSRLFFVPNNSRNQEAFLSSDPSNFIKYFNYSPICTDKKTGKRLFTSGGFDRHSLQSKQIGTLFLWMLPGFLVIFILGYITANRRKYILLRFLGTSRKKLLKDSLIGCLGSSFLGFAFGILLGILSVFCRNPYYNSHFGTTGLTFFTPFYSRCFVSLITFLAFALLFTLSILYFLLPRKRKKEEIKRK